MMMVKHMMTIFRATYIWTAGRQCLSFPVDGWSKIIARQAIINKKRKAMQVIFFILFIAKVQIYAKSSEPSNTVVLFLPSPSLRRFWLLLGLLCQFKTFLVLISLTKNTLVQISSLFAFLPRSPPLSPLIYFHSDQASTHFLTDKLRLFESLRTAGEFMRLISSFPFQLLSQNYFP